MVFFPLSCIACSLIAQVTHAIRCYMIWMLIITQVQLCGVILALWTWAVNMALFASGVMESWGPLCQSVRGWVLIDCKRQGLSVSRQEAESRDVTNQRNWGESYTSKKEKSIPCRFLNRSLNNIFRRWIFRTIASPHIHPSCQSEIATVIKGGLEFICKLKCSLLPSWRPILLHAGV